MYLLVRIVVHSIADIVSVCLFMLLLFRYRDCCYISFDILAVFVGVFAFTIVIIDAISVSTVIIIYNVS